MTLTEHFTQVKNGLLVLDRLFNQQKINYRVLGSVLVASLNGMPHRTLGDIDMLIDKKDFEKVTKGLKFEGYKIISKQKLGFHWTEAYKPNSLGFTFLLVGSFKTDYFSYHLSSSIELRISNSYLSPTEYSLLGVKFIGIPISSIQEGLKISDLNPKRKLDSEVVKRAINDSSANRDSLKNTFKVYFLGIEIPYAYPLFSQLYNLYGGFRVILGKKYEIWS